MKIRNLIKSFYFYNMFDFSLKHKNEQKDECFSDAVFDEHQKKVCNEVAEEVPRETDVDEHVLEEETEFEDKDFQVGPKPDLDNWTSRNLPSLLYGRLL